MVTKSKAMIVGAKKVCYCGPLQVMARLHRCGSRRSRSNPLYLFICLEVLAISILPCFRMIEAVINWGAHANTSLDIQEFMH